MDKRVCVAGAGVAGLTLSHLLNKSGWKVTIVEKNTAKIGCNCAWGAPEPDLTEALKDIFGEQKATNLLNDNILVKTKGLEIYSWKNTLKRKPLIWDIPMLTIDKPKLLKTILTDLTVDGVELVQKAIDKETILKYPACLDCTGTERAVFRACGELDIKDDLKIPCRQVRIKGKFKLKDADNLRAKIIVGDLGYAWAFPLGDDIWHVGAGDFICDTKVLMDKMLGLFDIDRRFCSCGETAVRVSGALSRQMIRIQDTRIIGCGESIGSVRPLLGEGIVPSMKCALDLHRVLTLSGGEIYDRVISEYYRRPEFNCEVEFIKSWLRGGIIGKLKSLKYIPAIKRNAREMHVDASLASMLKLVMLYRK